MELTDRVLEELRSRSPGIPVSAAVLAERLRCSIPEVLTAGESLVQRAPGDDEMVTMVKRSGADGPSETFLARLPLPLNDEPDDR
jgi:hypothetical protein